MFIKTYRNNKLIIFEIMKNNKFNFLLIFLLGFQILFVQIISDYPDIIETYYSNGVYPNVSKLFRMTLGWIPFSFGDVLIPILLFFGVRFFYGLIRNRCMNLKQKMVQAFAVISIFYTCFYWFWGFNYFREPLSKNLGLHQTKYTTSQLIQVTKTIAQQLDSIHFKISKNDTLVIESPYTVKELYQMSFVAYENLSKNFPQLVYEYPSVKSSLLSTLQSYNGTSGYLNPFTGEAQVNDKIPKTGYPTTICHEIAHQIGFAAENEANFIGYIAALAHEDPYFKYAAYRMAFAYLISEVKKHNYNRYKEIILETNKGVLKDYTNSVDFWNQYQNPIEPLIKKGYNSYLKANKQAEGIQSYHYVVDLIIAYNQSNHQENKLKL